MALALWLLALIVGGGVLWCAARSEGSEAPPTSPSPPTSPANLGKKVASFTLTDPRDQARFSLDDRKDKKALVVVFLGTECPINNSYMPHLVELHKEYAGKGVQFVGINANRTDSAQRVADHAKKHAIPFPMLKDPNNAVADQFGARRTPEVFLLDASGMVRYQGRIDDQYGIGFQRAKPTRRDLAVALDEVLSGNTVTQATTPVAGCVISRATPPKVNGPVTFSKHIARILQNNCQECHRPGQIGPMSLISHDDATGWAESIKEVVSERRMPPWFADPKYGKFSNDRRLPQQDYDTLMAWIDQGCPKGDEKDLPPPRQFADGWRIGKPDLVVTMPEEFEVPARAPKGGIPYQNFFVDPQLTEDHWVERAEAKAGSPEVVHHVAVFILPPGKRFFQNDPTIQTLAGSAPGDLPMIMPKDTAKRIPAGSKLIIQLHYTPNGKAQKDRSSVALKFAQQPPRLENRSIPACNPLFRIPAGAENHQVESSFILPKDGWIINFMPHMHLRGKDFLYEAIYPDGKTETLLSVPKYNFNWQSVYRLAEPKPVPKGTRIHCVAHFDNSAKNPNNPDPNKAAFWGDQTWEEMMIGWFDLAYERGEK
jgi:peroxiredoxin